MKLDRLEIENFRSIKHSEIEFHELTALVGENNAGKTAILKALNSFFNFDEEARDFELQIHQYAIRTVTKIQIVFSDVPDNQVYKEYLDDSKKLRILFTYNYSKSKGGRRLYSITNGKQIQIDKSFIDVIKNDIDFVYIPAGRSAKDLVWSKESIFSKLVLRYLDDYTQYRDTLSGKAVQAGNKLRDKVLPRLAAELSELNMCNDVGEYCIDFVDDIDYKVFLDKLGLKVLNDGMQGFAVEEYGSGIKSLTVIALHRMLAKLNNVSIILGVEEPETNLHPQAQRMLINALKNSRQQYETQAIFTTHSTVIVDELNHEDIVLVRRVIDNARSTQAGFHTETKQIGEDFWRSHSIEELKHYNFFRYRNSDFFFARYVILTESITDAQVIERIIGGELGQKNYYVSIVNMNGVDNIAYPFFLLKDLGIPFSVVVDKDFFVGYLNGKLEESRDQETCLPMYSTEVKRNKVIKAVFNDVERAEKLNDVVKQSYTRFFDYVCAYGFLPMQYCLEMDLVDNRYSRELYFNHYELEGDQRNNHSLLCERKNAIKDPTVLVPIVEKLLPKEYPYSFKKIRNVLIGNISKVF